MTTIRPRQLRTRPNTWNSGLAIPNNRRSGEGPAPRPPTRDSPCGNVWGAPGIDEGSASPTSRSGDASRPAPAIWERQGFRQAEPSRCIGPTDNPGVSRYPGRQPLARDGRAQHGRSFGRHWPGGHPSPPPASLRLPERSRLKIDRPGSTTGLRSPLYGPQVDPRQSGGSGEAPAQPDRAGRAAQPKAGALRRARRGRRPGRRRSWGATTFRA